MTARSSVPADYQLLLLQEENARLKTRLADLVVNDARWKAVRASPTLFFRLYEKSPELEKYFGRARNSERLNHGEISDRAADRLRMEKPA